MAVEFGAKLYLKDNMYATLKKNLGLSICSENSRCKPFISVRDKATNGITKVRNSLKSVGKTVAKPYYKGIRR